MALYWFRKSLRVFDNNSLHNLLEEVNPKFLICLFVIDPVEMTKVGENRKRFLFESLHCLDKNLKKHNNRLIILRGNPISIINKLIKKYKISYLGYEFDTEPYHLALDKKLPKIETVVSYGHTLYDVDEVLEKCKGNLPKSIASYAKLVKSLPIADPIKLGKLPRTPSNLESGLNPKSLIKGCKCLLKSTYPKYPRGEFSDKIYFIGGEDEGMRRFNAYVKHKSVVRNFNKPQTHPSNLDHVASVKGSTTGISPYLKHGCLSVRYVYKKLSKIGKKSSVPFQSTLVGQLLWREYFYFMSYAVKNFHKQSNSLSRNFGYSYSRDKKFQAWYNGMTGYPWIDALMRQLHLHGWMHHLGRHCVACFLTRGDLYKHWELGRDVFDELLVDDDYAMNNSNWMWVSASAFFTGYTKVYSPIGFGKKTDPNGDFIRHFVPELAKYPKKYIYEPWTAPAEIQEECECIIGSDYPEPIVDHSKVVPKNMAKIKKSWNKK